MPSISAACTATAKKDRKTQSIGGCDGGPVMGDRGWVKAELAATVMAEICDKVHVIAGDIQIKSFIDFTNTSRASHIDFCEVIADDIYADKIQAARFAGHGPT